MLTVLICSNCGGEKALPFTFEQEIHKGFCKECARDKTETKVWNFCSFDCALKFIRRIKTHKCGWYYKHSDSASVDEKNKTITVYERCSVCFDSRWRKIKGKELKKYRKDNKMMQIHLNWKI